MVRDNLEARGKILDVIRKFQTTDPNSTIKEKLEAIKNFEGCRHVA